MLERGRAILLDLLMGEGVRTALHAARTPLVAAAEAWTSRPGPD